MSQFWILALICLILCIIGAAMDIYNMPKDKRTTILWGYAIALGAGIFASWGLKHIPDTIVKSAALFPLIFFFRYLMRKYANRKS